MAFAPRVALPASRHAAPLPLARQPARRHRPAAAAAGGAPPPPPPPGGEAFSTVAGDVGVVARREADIDEFGESNAGSLHFEDDGEREPPAAGLDALLAGLRPADVLAAPFDEVKARAQALLGSGGSTWPGRRPQNGVFCVRTLNLRAIQAIGYDLDYTLAHYDVDAWEGRAWRYGMDVLRAQGFPTEGLAFDASLVCRGLVIDAELGNIVKADRFGFVKRAMHGTRMLTPREVHEAYGRELVALRNEARWRFCNTLFSVSEAVMYVQLVDRLDAGAVPPRVCPPSYPALWRAVSAALYRAHVEGQLKAEIMADPGRFVELDAAIPAALLDQRAAGKTLALITNSDAAYTDAILSYCFDRYLPPAVGGWRGLFDFVIVGARKPEFWAAAPQPLAEVVTPDGLMRPAAALRRGGTFVGGSARHLEAALGVGGEQILYVGDHIYTDAALAKLSFSWRTCLVLRELEAEMAALAAGRAHRTRLKELLNKKEQVGDLFNNLRLARSRALRPDLYGGGAPGGAALAPPPEVAALAADPGRLQECLAQLLLVMEALDEEIAPMVAADGAGFSRRWGYLSRAGVNDKSQLVRQIEKYADAYTSRVANFARYTPFCYLRSPSQAVAHDRPSADELVRGAGGNGAGPH